MSRPVQHAPATAPTARLQTAFRDALPSPQWALTAWTGLAVLLVDAGAWTRWLPEANALLDDAEAARVRRRRLAADRDLLTLAYAGHRLLLAAVLGCDPAAVPLYRDARGCPRLAGRPLHTSLSHADGCVALAASAIGPVGIDIEPAARAAAVREVAAAICHPAEAAALSGLDAAAHGAALLALWVRKEALLKAAGIGLARAMSSFRANGGELPIAGTCRARMLDAGPAWTAAVAGPATAAVSSAWLRPPAG